MSDNLLIILLFGCGFFLFNYFFVQISLIVRFLFSERAMMYVMYFVACFTIFYMFVMLWLMFQMRDYQADTSAYDTELNEITIPKPNTYDITDDDL